MTGYGCAALGRQPATLTPGGDEFGCSELGQVPGEGVAYRVLRCCWWCLSLCCGPVRPSERPGPTSAASPTVAQRNLMVHSYPRWPSPIPGTGPRNGWLRASTRVWPGRGLSRRPGRCGRSGRPTQGRRRSPPGDGGDHAVDHPSRGDTRSPAETVDAYRAGEVGGRVEAENSNRSKSRRRSDSRRSSRAPARTSMMTGSVTATGPSVRMRSVRRRSAGLSVERSYSTHAEVSTRITEVLVGECPREPRRWRARLAWPAPARGHGFAGQVTQREVDGFRLGPNAMAIHDGLYVHILDLDVGANSAHTPMIHVWCR